MASANAFEQLFDSFIRQHLDGSRVDEKFPEFLSSGSKNADYVFPNDQVLIELKSLEQSHDGQSYLEDIVKEAFRKAKLPVSPPPWPRKVRQLLDRKVNNSLKNAVRSANMQLKVTDQTLGGGFGRVLLVAISDVTVFEYEATLASSI